MRVRLQIPLIIIALAVLLLGASRYSLRPRYSECLTDEAFFFDLPDTRSEDKTLLPDLWFGEERLLCDTETGTYYYSLIEGDETAFDPAVRLSGGTRAEVAFSELITEESIKTNHAIPFVVYTEDSFCRLQLCCTTLPLITLSCDTDIEQDVTYNIAFSLFDNRKEAIQRVISSEATIHTRGVTTSAFPKYGLKISLKAKSLGGNLRSNPLSLLGMRQDDDWTLYAGYNDPEKIRNVFSMKLWRDSCAVDNHSNLLLGTEYKYVEVLLNGRYQGLYAICPPIDEKQVGLNGNLHEQALYKYGDFVGDELVRNEFGGIEAVQVKHQPASRDNNGNREYIESDYELLTEYYDG
ncbi:MAG: CotH kinase family protein, partial [Lachnospiraceae bacterium]|nr:CotH kinase family protein [Lachnospiraceae bacterium]